jgi:hypothetical protein
MAFNPADRCMFMAWSMMSDELQLMVAREALRRASDVIAGHADELAIEMEIGSLRDRGGPEALRLLAAIVRLGAEVRTGAGQA